MCGIRVLFENSRVYRRFAPGQLIYCAGEAGLIKAGTVTVSYPSVEGHEVFCQIKGTGDVLNVLGDSHATFRAVNTTYIQFVPLNRIDRTNPDMLTGLFAESQGINQSLVANLSRQTGWPIMSRVQWAVAELEAKGYTVHLGRNMGRGKLPVLSLMAGCAPEVVCRALKKLRSVSYDTKQKEFQP
jgi:hypothetical protein